MNGKSEENFIVKKNFISNFILILIFFVGISLMLYPTVSDYWNSFHQSRAVAEYAGQVANLDNDLYKQLLEEARQYNETLRGKNDYHHMSDQEMSEYESKLNISETGIMGYIEIPSIDVSLPIYHSTRESVLQIAVGHIEWSSLPVGGKGTHSVLSGHRGLPSAKLFTDLDKLVEGDTFLIRVLDETLTYEVDQIRIVLPEELDFLEIEDGEDLCTLVTCTPYGINTHRLLVRGHRIENDAQAKNIRVTADAILIEPIVMAPIVAVPILIILLVLLLVKTRKKK